MASTITLSGLILKPTTHTILISSSADPIEEAVADYLVDALKKISDRGFYPIKDVQWLRNRELHRTVTDTQSRIPIVVGNVPAVLSEFSMNDTDHACKDCMIIETIGGVGLSIRGTSPLLTKCASVRLLEEIKVIGPRIEGEIVIPELSIHETPSDQEVQRFERIFDGGLEMISH